MVNDIVKNSRASQNKIELAFLLAEVDQITPKTILEIGTWRGWLLDTFNEAFAPNYMLGIETDVAVLDPEMAQKYQILYADSHKPETLESVKDYFRGTPIDFLFIDGDHTYNGVKQDYEMYAQLVRPGGIIAFHDVALDGEKWVAAGVEVKRFWDEITKGRTCRVFHDTTGQGTGTGVIHV